MGCSEDGSDGSVGSGGDAPSGGPDDADAGPRPGPIMEGPAAEGRARAGRITRASELLSGRLARGRVGDYRIDTSRVAFVIEGLRPSDGYQPWGGGILDAARVGVDGAFGRTWLGEILMGIDERGLEPDRIEVIADGSDGRAAHLRVEGDDSPYDFVGSIFATEELPGTLAVDYLLEPEAEALEVRLTYLHGAGPAQVIRRIDLGFMMGDGAQPYIPGVGFSREALPLTFPYYAAIEREVGYALAPVSGELSFVLDVVGMVMTIVEGGRAEPGEALTWGFRLAVGKAEGTDLEAILRGRSVLEGGALLPVRVVDANDVAVEGARVHVARGDRHSGMARTDTDGVALLELAPGPGRVHVFADAGRAVATDFVAAAGQGETITLALPPDGKLRFEVQDETGRPVPARVDVRRTDGGGPAAPAAMFGEPAFPHGLSQRIFSSSGEGTVALPPGSYEVVATHGFEWTVARADADVPAGGSEAVTLGIERVVDTTGYVSGDFHLHAQRSPDSSDSDELKVAALAAEGVEVGVASEHEHVGDYSAAVQALGLEEWVLAIAGEEVTTFEYGHFNVFPMVPDPTARNRGAFSWFGRRPGELFEAIREGAPADHVIQVNHPRSTAIFGYMDAAGFLPDVGIFRNADNASLNFDAMEVGTNRWFGDLLETPALADWNALIGRGARITATGNSDSHSAVFSNVGLPRNLIGVGRDDPRDVSAQDIASAILAMRNVVSAGPFLRVSIDGRGMGELVAAGDGGVVRVEARVEGPPWMDLRRLRLYVDGVEVEQRALHPTSGLVVRWDEAVDLVVDRDAFIVIAADGDLPMDPVAAGTRAAALTNPIFVDADGDGVWTPPFGAIELPEPP
jgi:hypothetical protein